MPVYEYRCTNGHTFEVIQSMSDDPISACEVCGAPVERVFYPVAVHFKGSGFYTTDYGRARSAADSGKDDSKPETRSESKDTAATKSESSSSSGGSSSDD